MPTTRSWTRLPAATTEEDVSSYGTLSWPPDLGWCKYEKLGAANAPRACVNVCRRLGTS